MEHLPYTRTPRSDNTLSDTPGASHEAPPQQGLLFPTRPRPRPAWVRPLRARSLASLGPQSGLKISRQHFGGQAQRVLTRLKVHGPATDYTMAASLDVALASINAVRNALTKVERIEAVGLVIGPYDARRTLWELIA